MSGPAPARTALPDQGERDVISGRLGLDSTVFVDAGAGTGKTTELVNRVVNLVRAGVPVTRIAAITFTEAAAAELRHRVRTRLEHVVGDDPDSTAATRAQDALDHLDEATFATLHAFAHRILADHPLQAGLPPDLAVLNEIEEAAAFDQRWEAWLASFVNRPEVRPALQQMDLVELTIPRVRRLADELHRSLHRIPHDLPRQPRRYEPPPFDLTEVDACVDDLADLVAHGRETAPDDKLVARLQAWLALGTTLQDQVGAGATRSDVFACLQAISDAPSLGNVGTAKAWGDLGGGKAVRDRAKLLPQAVNEAIADQADHLLRELTAWTAAFVLDWAEHRRRDATVVFHDLLVLARDVVRDDASVRRQVAGRFDHLLIDEFQDTDPLQIELAVLLAARDPDALAATADASGSIAWERAELVPGRLFFVGDPKQSIYRFRGADIAVYEGAKRFVVGGGDQRTLHHNFRSVPGVIDWVNAVFADLMEPEALAQPAYRALTAARNVDTASPAVRWFGARTDESAQDTRLTEASEVVDIVAALVGTEQVRDPRTRQLRPARASDIAVLVRRHATARQLERCFDDAGMALIVEARSLVFGTEEVRDLTNLLTAIEDPNDGVAVVAALRHPAIGCSDADLLTWRSGGGGWWVPDEPERATAPDGVAADHPVARGLVRLSALRAARVDRTVGGFVEHVIDDLHLMELALAQPRSRDRWRRIRFVADQAHAYHAAGGHLRGFVRWLREQEEEGVTRHEHVVADPDDDAVRVTTVHAAKGLEYPIVIVLGLDSKVSRPPHDERLLWAPDGHPEVNLGTDLKTSGYVALRDGTETIIGARRHHEHEEARLLYVATTRARDLLVLSLYHSDGDCHAAHLVERRDELDRFWGQQPTEPATPVAAEASPQPAHPGDDPAALDAFARRHHELADRARRPQVLAATTIAGLLDDAPLVAPSDGLAQHADYALPAPGPEDGALRRGQLLLPGTDPDATPADASTTANATTTADATTTAEAATPADGLATAPGAGDRMAPAPGTRDVDDEASEATPWRRGRAGSAVGRAVHAVLQSIDLATLGDLDALARTHCAAEGLPVDDAVLVADRVRRAADTPIVAQALAGGRLWRELHVGAPAPLPGPDGDDSVPVLEGFIDLLAEVDGNLVVVDWKTDRTDGRTPTEMVARYRPQAATYALALEASLGRPVERCVFVLTGVTDRARRQVEIAGTDLQAAKDNVLRALRPGDPGA